MKSHGQLISKLYGGEYNDYSKPFVQGLQKW